MPSRLHARRQMLKVLYPVVEVKDGKKRSAKEVDLVENYSQRSLLNMRAVTVVTQES